jgi:magnesium transporter
LPYLRKEFASLQEKMTVQQALDAIRAQQPDSAIVYFYVLDEAGRLVGIVPTRGLLVAALDRTMADIMLRRVVVIPHTATVLEACEFFVLYKLLALPVVDEEQKLIGVVDVNLLTEEAVNLAEKTKQEQTEDVFETIGFRLSEVRGASPLKAFRYRFPWLLATLTSGVLCALLASAFETTLARSVIIAFFLALVLALGEAVGVQSVALAIQSLRGSKVTLAWFLVSFRRELAVSILLGLAAGLATFCLVFVWRGAGAAALVVGATVSLALSGAGILGLTVPALLHAGKLDPKIAAGPITLALTDVFSLAVYFTLAKLLL